MTRHERLMTIFRGGIPDRPAVKLWNADFDSELLHPAFRPIRDAAIELSDLFITARSPFSLNYGRRHDQVLRLEIRPSDSPDWVDHVYTVATPGVDGSAGRTLRSVHVVSTRGHPGYCREHLLKEPQDIWHLLAIPYEPLPFDPRPYHEMVRRLGDAGVAAFGLDHAMYGLQRLIGSENFALWSVECGDLLLEAIEEYARRLRDEVKRVFAAGIRPVFAWVGPELCIPPLMSPADFDRYVFPQDKALIDLIHDGGGYAWVHSHGKMSPVIERFAAMGVDVLNPIEPPPMGDVTLAQAFAMVGDRMGLEGNIETHDLMTAEPERVRELIHEALDVGRGRRHILCPSSGYMEDPEPSPRLIENFLFYVKEGVRYADSLPR